MFNPPHWNHSSTYRFPDNEIDEVISKMKEVVPKQYGNYSTYHKDSEQPQIVFKERYIEIIQRALSDIGIYNVKYSFCFWAQLYTTDCLHESHHHFTGGVDISFVHFIRVPDVPLFRFVNNKGDYYVPQQSEGELLFFPSWVWHEVMPHKSDKERFVIAGNINIDDMRLVPSVHPERDA